MQEETKAVLMFLSVLFFFMGFVLTDYGATLRVSGGHGESLVLPEIPPRVTYHMGLVSAVVGFFLLYTVAVSYFVDIPRPRDPGYRVTYAPTGVRTSRK